MYGFFTCMHTYACMCVYMPYMFAYVCVHVLMCVNTYACGCVHIKTKKCMRTTIKACIYLCIFFYIWTLYQLDSLVKHITSIFMNTLNLIA